MSPDQARYQKWFGWLGIAIGLTGVSIGLGSGSMGTFIVAWLIVIGAALRVLSANRRLSRHEHPETWVWHEEND